MRIPPGHESFVHHSHEHEEEFLYEVGPGDFMGFVEHVRRFTF